MMCFDEFLGLDFNIIFGTLKVEICVIKEI